MNKKITKIISSIKTRISFESSVKNKDYFSHYVTETNDGERKGLVYNLVDGRYINIDVSCNDEEKINWYTAMLGFAANRYFHCNADGEKI